MGFFKSDMCQIMMRARFFSQIGDTADFPKVVRTVERCLWLRGDNVSCQLLRRAVRKLLRADPVTRRVRLVEHGRLFRPGIPQAYSAGSLGSPQLPCSATA